MLKVKPNIDVSKHKIDDKDTYGYASISDDNDIPLEQVAKEFNTSFVPIDINNPSHKEELFNMSPLWLYKTANEDDLEHFHSMCRYDSKNKTAVVGCFRNNPLKPDELISHKKRRFYGKKWMTRKGTHPNGVPFTRISSDDGTVFVVEGHHDMLTAVLLGLDFIMIPTSGFKNATLIKNEVAGRDVVFIVEDRSAFLCMSKLALAIEEVASSVVLKQLGQGKKFDLSDYVMTKNSIEEVHNGLKNRQSN